MRLQDSIALSLRIFTTRPKRTFLTILGVGVGISAVLFLVSLGYGLQGVILGKITTADSLLSLDVASADSTLVPIDEEFIEEMVHFPHVTEVARVRKVHGQLDYQDLTTSTTFRAVDPNYFRLGGITASSGRLFALNDHADMVLSAAAVKLLGLDPTTAIDRQLTIAIGRESTAADGTSTIEVISGDHSFRIVGVIDDQVESYAYLPLGAADDIVPLTTFDTMKLKVDSRDTAEPVREHIVARGYTVSALSDVIDQAKQIFRVVNIVLAAFGLIALVVSAIGMFNTMTIALLERTNEIGIMRSIGVSRADVQRLFVTEAMLMGLLGGLGGVGMGILAGELTNLGFNLLANRLGGVAVDLFAAPVWFIAVIIVFSTVIGFLTGIFPAIRAAKMDPLEALRYK